MGKLIDQFSKELRGQTKEEVKELNTEGVSDPFERYVAAQEKKERFEVTFGYAANDGALSGVDEFGVELILDGEQLSRDLSYYSVEHRASFVGVPFTVRVKEVDEEAGVVYLSTAWSDSKDTRARLIAEIERELKKREESGDTEPLVVPGRIMNVSEERALVDILGKGVLGIIKVQNWKKGYVRYFTKTVKKGDIYDFVIQKKLPRKSNSRVPAFALTRKPLTEDPWQNIPKKLQVGTVITVKCLGRPQGKTYWWGSSPMVEGIELMADYTEKFARPIIGVSYKCKITTLDPVKHRFQVVPFALASKDTGTAESVEFIQSKKPIQPKIAVDEKAEKTKATGTKKKTADNKK